MTRKRESLSTNERRAAKARSWRGSAAHFPTKCTEERTAAICEQVEKGCPVGTAAPLAGVTSRAAEMWIEKGRGFERNEGEPAEDACYFAFLVAYELARSRYLSGLIARAHDPRTPVSRAKLCIGILSRRDATSWSERWRPPVVTAEDADLLVPNEAYL